MAKIGDTIRINFMDDQLNGWRYAGKEGVIERIDAIGQLHGTWGGLAVVPGVDSYTVIKKAEDNE